MTTLTTGRLNILMTQAYRDMGYEVVRFSDGSFGVLKCPAKTLRLMTHFAHLIDRELPTDCKVCGGTRKVRDGAILSESTLVECPECGEA